MLSHNKEFILLAKQITDACNKTNKKLNVVQSLFLDMKEKCRKNQNLHQSVNQSVNQKATFSLLLHVLVLENNENVCELSPLFLKYHKSEIESTVKLILTTQTEVSEHYDSIVLSQTIKFINPTLVKITLELQSGTSYEQIQDLSNDLVHGLHDGACDGYLEGDDRIDDKEIIFDYIQRDYDKYTYKYPTYWI